MSQSPTREWLDQKKSRILDSTDRVLRLLNCLHEETNCGCVSEIKNEINAIVSDSADLKPYATNERLIDLL